MGDFIIGLQVKDRDTGEKGIILDRVYESEAKAHFLLIVFESGELATVSEEQVLIVGGFSQFMPEDSDDLDESN